MKKHAKTPTVLQMEATECGAASLAMIFAFYGKYFSLEQLRMETGVSRDGCNAGNLMRCAKKYGLECHGYRKRSDELKEIVPPCILHWNNNHFVVFEGFNGKHVWINDPAVGRRKLTAEEFDASFSGIILTFNPTSSFAPEKKKHGITSFMFKGIGREAASLLKLFAAGIVLIIPCVWIPFLTQRFVDSFFTDGNRDAFRMIALSLLGAAALQAFLIMYKYRVTAKLQKKLTLLSAKDFLIRLFRLPIVFFQQRYAGELTNRISGNTRIITFLSSSLPETLISLSAACVYIAVLIRYSPVLTLAALAGLAANTFFAALINAGSANDAAKLKQENDSLFGTFCTGIGISETIKVSGTENIYSGKAIEHYEKAAALHHKTGRVRMNATVLMNVIYMLTVVIIVLLGGYLIIREELTAGKLIAFIAVYGLLSEPFNRSFGMLKTAQKTKADIDSIEDILRYPQDEKFEKEVHSGITNKLKGYVELQNIAFGYNRTAPPIISSFSVKLGCGQSIAIVGSSGCGKSTVAKILSGLYAPWSGTVLFDGTDTDDIPNEVLSASIASVSQQNALFSGTVRDNITMWNNSISDSDLVAAAKDACIHDVISQKPGDYNYRLTEEGNNFSGGQRQRLEIARALATNPTILILDEATSALDTVTEKQIMYNIKRRGCTCIIMAHRLSTVRDCDEILVMEKGTILQRGTHEELAASNSFYRQLVNTL